MKFTSKSVNSTPEILKRHTGAELIVPVTVANASFTGGVCKAGTPLDASGAIANTASVKGILLNDVTSDDPNGALIVAFATINVANAKANSGVTYADAMKSALKNVIFD